MTFGIEEIENIVIHDDVDFEIIKYVDKFIKYDVFIQKDILHQIITYAIDSRSKTEKFEKQLEEEKHKYNTIYGTNVILTNQLKCAERVNDTLLTYNNSFIQEIQIKRDFTKKLMKYIFLFGFFTSVAGYYYVSKKL